MNTEETTTTETVEQEVQAVIPEYVLLTAEEASKYTDEELAAKLKDLEEKSTKIGEEFKSKLYPVKVENIKNTKSLIEFLEKDAKWNHRNVPHLVACHHGFKEGLKAGIDVDGNVFVKSIVIENIYNMLLSVEGNGFFEAKRYLTILTEIGGAISEAMKLLHDEQALFTNYHTDLATLDNEQTARSQGIKVEINVPVDLNTIEQTEETKD